MGQSVSSQASEKLTHDQVMRLFAARCAKQFKAIEIWSLKVSTIPPPIYLMLTTEKDTFAKLAERENDIVYWKQDTL